MGWDLGSMVRASTCDREVTGSIPTGSYKITLKKPVFSDHLMAALGGTFVS